MNRAEAFELLKKYNKEEFHIKHGDFLTPSSCCTMIYLQSVVSNRQVELPQILSGSI